MESFIQGLSLLAFLQLPSVTVRKVSGLGFATPHLEHLYNAPPRCPQGLISVILGWVSKTLEIFNVSEGVQVAN